MAVFCLHSSIGRAADSYPADGSSNLSGGFGLVWRTKGRNSPNSWLPDISNLPGGFMKKCLEDICVISLNQVTPYEAREQGYVASEQAYSIEQNPYPHHLIAHAWWEAGHSQATDDLCGRGI